MKSAQTLDNVFRFRAYGKIRSESSESSDMPVERKAILLTFLTFIGRG